MRYATSSRKRARLHDQLRREVEARREARKAIPIRPIQIKEPTHEHVRQYR